MTNTLVTKDALELASENYREYSLYISKGRSYPGIVDGAKSVQKRVIYSLYKKAPRIGIIHVLKQLYLLLFASASF